MCAFFFNISYICPTEINRLHSTHTELHTKIQVSKTQVQAIQIKILIVVALLSPKWTKEMKKRKKQQNTKIFQQQSSWIVFMNAIWMLLLLLLLDVCINSCRVIHFIFFFFAHFINAMMIIIFLVCVLCLWVLRASQILLFSSFILYFFYLALDLKDFRFRCCFIEVCFEFLCFFFIRFQRITFIFLHWCWSSVSLRFAFMCFYHLVSSAAARNE